MRACSRCGYESADHLAFCVQCGRRSGTFPAPAPLQRAASGAFAATVVLSDANGLLRSSEGLRAKGNPATWGLDSVRYVFEYVRGRLDADARRRRLIEEREGAARMVAGALAELGQAILDEGVNSPELTGLLEEVGRAQAQRETAIAETAATEAFRASEESRLAAIEASASAELGACEKGIEETDRALRQNDDERRRLTAALAAAPSPGAERAATELRRTHLDQEHDTLRERAAALRAAGLAARAKVDQATASRRQALAALTASITGHARERAEAESRMEALKSQIGRLSWQLRLVDVELLPRYERLDRHQQTITERERQIAMVETMIARYDKRKLGVGIGVLTGMIVVTTLLLRALLR